MQAARGGGQGAALQDGADAGDQFAGREGFGHIIVRAKFKADDAVDLIIAGGQEQDRHGRAGADAAANLEPVQFGQADVQHDEVRGFAHRVGQGQLAVGSGDHGEIGALQRD